jgi:hypothetical protein
VTSACARSMWQTRATRVPSGATSRIATSASRGSPPPWPPRTGTAPSPRAEGDVLAQLRAQARGGRARPGVHGALELADLVARELRGPAEVELPHAGAAGGGGDGRGHLGSVVGARGAAA